MKKIILLIVMIWFWQSGWSQDSVTYDSHYQAVYNFEYQRDSTDKDTQRSEKMILFIGDDYSLFESYNNRYNDSLGKAIDKKYPDMSEMGQSELQQQMDEYSAARKKTHFNFRILKSKHKTEVYDYFLIDKFIYEDKDDLDWDIAQTRDTINGYPATLATTHFAGRDYEAWFTEEIPMNDGPYKFKGLPGLIIKVEDRQKQYVIELLSFKEKDESFTFDLDKPKRVSKEEYFKAYSNFKKNFARQLAQGGFMFKDEETKRDMKKRIKKNTNNAIEIAYTKD